jgi:glycosyltransferase involved in cell wall biosynthesis
LVADLGLGGRVSLLGWSDEASGYMRSFDVLAMPSRYEGLPLTLLEGMLSGVAIVATTVGGIPDAVRDGDSALLVPPDDVAALTAALRRLAEDPSLRMRLGAAAEQDGRGRFAVDAMARSYVAVYDEILSTRGSRRGGRRTRSHDGRRPVP